MKKFKKKTVHYYTLFHLQLKKSSSFRVYRQKQMFMSPTGSGFGPLFPVERKQMKNKKNDSHENKTVVTNRLLIMKAKNINKNLTANIIRDIIIRT